MPQGIRFLYILMISVIGLTVSGCASTEDVMYLEQRLAVLEDQNRVRAEKMDALDQKFTLENQGGKQQAARQRVLLDKIREENRRLQGQLDELANRLGYQDASFGDPMSPSFTQLDQKIAANARRLVRLEQHLGLKRPDPSAVSTPPSDATQQKKDMTEQEMYARAKRSYDESNFETAREEFRQLLKRYPNSSSADNAQFWVGETYYREQWYEKAILEYQKVIKDYPLGNKTPAAYLKQGYAFDKIGDHKNARLVFQTLIRKFPKSSEAGIAAKKL